MKSATKEACGLVAAVVAVRGGTNAETLTAAQASTKERAILLIVALNTDRFGEFRAVVSSKLWESSQACQTVQAALQPSRDGIARRTRVLASP